MAANNLRGYLIMPNQTLQILMADQVVQHQQLQQAMAMHHLLITKIYTLLVNVWYVFDRRAQAGSPKHILVRR